MNPHFPPPSWAREAAIEGLPTMEQIVAHDKSHGPHHGYWLIGYRWGGLLDDTRGQQSLMMVRIANAREYPRCYVGGTCLWALEDMVGEFSRPGVSEILWSVPMLTTGEPTTL